MTCKKHPKYKGIRKPRANCEACWRIYLKTENKPKPTKNKPKPYISRIDANCFPYG